MAPASSIWTEDLITKLKELWAEGLSATQISERFYILGVEASRNSIIGKVHRLKVPGREKPAPAGRKKKPRKSRARAAPTGGSIQHRVTMRKIDAQKPPKPKSHGVAGLSVEGMDPPASLGVKLLDLSPQMCRYPHGDPDKDEFAFCGHRRHNMLPYCEYHSRLCYVPHEIRRRQRPRP